MTSGFKRILCGLALFAVLLGGANATLLSTLLGGGSITAGDKLFDNWQLIGFSATDGRQFDATKIDVTALNDGGMDPGPGLRFSFRDGAMTMGGDGLYAFIDLTFGFRATVLTADVRMVAGNLAYSAGGAFYSHLVDNSYEVGSSIGETLGTAAGLNDLGAMAVEFSTLKDGSGATSTSVISDTATYAAQSSVWVTNNLLVWAVDTGDSAGIFGFDQRFAQSAVPEPGTLVLLGAAALAFGLARKRLNPRGA